MFWNYLFHHLLEVAYVNLLSLVNQTYQHVLCYQRFGGSRSSRSQAASKASDRTAGSGTETADRAADSDSEEGADPKDDLDPFLSQGESDTTKCEWEISYCRVKHNFFALYVGTKAGVESVSLVAFVCGAFYTQALDG